MDVLLGEVIYTVGLKHLHYVSIMCIRESVCLYVYSRVESGAVLIYTGGH